MVSGAVHHRADHAAELQHAIEPNRVVCQDEMLESVDPEDLQSRLWGMFPYMMRGVMSLPAPSDDPAEQVRQLQAVRVVFEHLRSQGLPLDTLSMGMSADLEAAIACGSTLVRVGTALFGVRADPA